MRQQNRKTRPNPKLLSCALATCLALGVAPAWAQSTGATLRGQVSVAEAPASGARVTATNLATGLTRSVQTGAGGGYSLGGLPPGSYRIDVTANGQTSSRDITLAVGQTATLNLGVGAAPSPDATTLETVQVTAPVLVETKTSEVATYVTQKQIEALPQNSRNFLAFADVVPGVMFRTGNDGSTSLRSGAQVSNSINVYIDGVGQKDYVLKGGITGQDTSRGNPFPQLGIAEYKVITSNYKAEYDQLSSAAITAVTQSGTNEFHGDFFWDYSFEGWREATPQEEAAGMKTPSKDEQYGASLGGPIIRDRLHFFVAYEAKEYNTPKQITPGRQYTVDELPEQFRSLALASVGAPFKEDLFFGKLSWTPGDAHLIELTGKYRDEDELANVGGENLAEFGTLKLGKDTRIDLRYQYSAENWLNDAHITYEDATFGPSPATIAPGYNLRVIRADSTNNPNRPVMENILNLGGGADKQEKGQKGTGLQNDFTFFGWEGHTVKMGVKYKQIDIVALQQTPFNPQFRYDIDRSLDVPYEVSFGAIGLGSTGPVGSEAKQFGIYIQDDWEVNEHLTLNMGIRWDYEKDPNFEDHVTPAGIVDALRNYPAINGANAAVAGFDYNDYISTGSNRSSFKDGWQPRVGFSYDLWGDQRHVIFGGAGRSYNRNQFDYLARERYGLAFQSYTYYFNIPGHDCTPLPGVCLAFDPRYLDPNELAALAAADPTAGTTTYLLNNNIKTPYSDQFSLGIRNTFGMLGHEWNSSVTLLHVVSHDGILFTVGNRRPDGTYFEPGRTFGNAPPDDLPGYGRLLLGDNAVETRLNSVLLSLEKPYTRESGWGTTFAYTFSDAKENRNNSDTFSFDYPNLDDVAFTEALGVAKHRLVATGIVDFWGFTLSGKLTLASPEALEGLNCYAINDFNCYFDPFYPNETFGTKQLDLALQREWDTGTDLRFRIRADVLNVFNWHNWTNYDTWRGINGSANANFGQRNGLGTTWPPRAFKLTFGISW